VDSGPALNRIRDTVNSYCRIWHTIQINISQSVRENRGELAGGQIEPLVSSHDAEELYNKVVREPGNGVEEPEAENGR
jgi:hypothetical protein